TGINGYTLNYQSGDQMGGASVVQLSSIVAPNGQTTFSLPMTAPTTAGTYTGFWRMNNSAGAGFGVTLSVKIIVQGTSPATTLYDRTAAVNYARKYALSVSSDGYFWGSGSSLISVGAGQPVPTGSGVAGGIG